MASFWQKLVERFRHPPKPKHHPWLFGILAFVLFLMLFFFSALGGLRVFLPYYPELTGFPFGSRNYIVVFQNQQDLRPGGGAIVAYGIARFQSGFLTDFEVKDSNLWDANGDGDYPKNAQAVLQVAEEVEPEHASFDGVIAVNYSFLQDLLGVLGSVLVNGKIIDKNSLPKNNLGQFASALISKIMFSPFKLRKVNDAIVHGLTSKELQVFFKNPGLQKVVMDQGWSSQWPQSWRGDALAVMETNKSGEPLDPYLQRQVNYHLLLSKNPANRQTDLISDVFINLSYSRNENFPSSSYKGIFTIAVPGGSRPIDVPSDFKTVPPGNEQGLLYISSPLVELKPGESTQLHFRYQLPSTILANDHYQLFIPKQSGTNEDYYTIIVEGPAGRGIESNDFTAKGNLASYQEELSADLNLSLKLIPSS